MTCSVYDLDPAVLGTFDFVHAADLMVHPENPLRALRAIRRVTRGRPSSPTASSRSSPAGLLRYDGGWSGQQWWSPSMDTLAQMVLDSGFSEVSVRTVYSLAGTSSDHGPWRVCKDGPVKVGAGGTSAMRSRIRGQATKAVPNVARLVARAARGLPPVRSRGRLAHIAHRRLGGCVGESFAIPMRGGHRMLAPMGSAQSWSAAFTGSYDDEVIELLRSYVAEGDLIVDVGACLGFYTVPLAMAAQAGRGHVLAVEPVAANRAILEANLALNQVTDVVSIVPCGLGRVTTEVTVHIESLGSGNATIVSGLDPSEIARHDRDGWTGATETVRLHRLDDLDLSPGVRARRCCLMKIDVEGFEEDVLAGASAFVAAHRPAILAEFNPDWLETRGSAQSLPVEWAEANDYDCWELVHLRRRPWSESKKISLRPLVPGTARTGSDLLFLPRT